MIIPTLLTYVLVTASECQTTDWEHLRTLRRAAFNAGEYTAALAIVDCEAAALARIPSGDSRRRTADGAVASPCQPLEVGFHVCDVQRQDLDCAERYLRSQAAAGCHDDPAYAAQYHRNEALLLRRRQDLRAALTALESAIAASEMQFAEFGTAAEVDVWLEQATSDALRLDIEAQFADFDAVRLSLVDVVERLALVDHEAPRMAADIQNLVAWSLLLARDADPGHGKWLTREARALLQAALDRFSAGDSPAGKADNVRINLALAALQDGEPQQATRWLAEVRESTLAPEERLWLHYMTIRTALAQGAPAALAEPHAALAARGEVPMAKWFVEWTRGLEADVAGRTSEALAAYAAAEAVLEDDALEWSKRPQAFLDGRLQRVFGGVSRRLVGLLVEAGDTAAAAQVARRARNRVLRTAVRERCEAGAREAPAAPGELRLLYFRAAMDPALGSPTGERWIGFAIGATGVRVAELSVPKPLPEMYKFSEEALQPWSDALLVPFAAELATASTVVILATDELHEVPFHALPWAGEVLIATAPVVYSLDIAGCDAPARAGAGRVVTVRGHDSRFMREVEVVGSALAASGVAVESWQPHTAKELAPLGAGEVRLVHFVVHGGLRDSLVAADDRLAFTKENATGLSWTSHDVGTGAHQPEIVYLSACRTSFRDAETLGGSSSLAHAFLLGGSRYVVAPVHNLDGEAAVDIAERFYRELGAGSDVARAFRAAFLDCRANCRPRVWPHLQMFRVYTR